MAYAIRRSGGWEEIVGPFEIDDVQYPANWPDCADEDERAALGILPIAEAAAAPADAKAIGLGLGGTEAPVREWITEPHPLEDARKIVWERVKELRNACMAGGCSTPLGRMDSDQDSQRKLNGAVTNALIAQLASMPFFIDWTMADDSVVTHDGPQIIAAGTAVAQHFAACQSRGTALRSEIEASAEPFAIGITTGWPGTAPA
jgi:hypothetical protein